MCLIRDKKSSYDNISKGDKRMKTQEFQDLFDMGREILCVFERDTQIMSQCSFIILIRQLDTGPFVIIAFLMNHIVVGHYRANNDHQ